MSYTFKQNCSKDHSCLFHPCSMAASTCPAARLPPIIHAWMVTSFPKFVASPQNVNTSCSIVAS
eukprot:m.50303 g.50303  ORF g.50303 m.50303 type:complete len:64 (+) comp10660_c0_seq1:2597-2788(+)